MSIRIPKYPPVTDATGEADERCESCGAPYGERHKRTCNPDTLARERFAFEMNAIEDKIYAAQERWIRKRFGDDAADNANYGWGVDVVDEHHYVLVATKIYGHGVLHSEAAGLSDRVSHDFYVWEKGR